MSFVLGFDSWNFVYQIHHIAIVDFLIQYLVYDQDVTRAREKAWGGRLSRVSSASVVLLRSNGNGVQANALVFGHSKHGVFGLRPPCCPCKTDPINSQVQIMAGGGVRFECSRCGKRSRAYTRPKWVTSLPGSDEVWSLPFPSPTWETE